MTKFSNIYSLSVVCGLIFQGCGMKPIEDTSRSNLIYIFPDQFRKTAMGFWEEPNFKGAIPTKGDPVYTPNLNRFANESMVFTSFTTPAPICSPSRSCILTGMFPSESGVPFNCTANRPYSSLRDDVTCFSDVLASKNYDLAYFGKWHLDFPTRNNPQNSGTYVEKRRPAWDAYTPPIKRHGFNYWYSYGTSNEHKNPHYWDTQGNRHDPHEYSPKHEADMAIKYLKNENGERQSNKPFAIFVGMNPPHTPYSSINDCMEIDYNRYKGIALSKLLVRANADTTMEKAASAPYYFANVTGVDREFGRILDELKKLGLDKNTIVIFSSDHGETMCSHGIEDPKNVIYNEAFEIPFLIRWPGKIKSEISRMLMSTPDIMPTLLGLMGFKKDIPSTVKGTDYSSLLLGEKNKIDPPQAVLYVMNTDGSKDSLGIAHSYFPVARGVQNHRYSLEFAIDQDEKLTAMKFFDNQNDPYQMNNMPVKKTDMRVQQLVRELAGLLKKSEDPWYKKRILSDWLDYK